MSNLTHSNFSSGCTDPGSDYLLAYACWYFNVHGILALVLCCFGIPTNIVNIIVLTRKNMRTPINCILTGIAISDAITMLDYVPWVIHFYIMHGVERTNEKYTYGWVWYLIMHTNVSITTHTIAIWLGVLLALVRFIYIWSMGRGRCSISNTTACVIVVAVYALTIAINIPNYKYYKVESINETGTVIYYMTRLDLTGIYVILVYLIYGKFLPCILITFFGGLLLYTLHQSKKRTLTLRGASCKERLRQHRRTTTMLLLIILMFILTTIPSAISLLLSLFDDDYFMKTYPKLADTLDMLSLVNNTANFVMYCAMSRQFRDTLVEITCDKIVGSTENQSTKIRSGGTATMTHMNASLLPTTKKLSNASQNGTLLVNS